MYLKKCNSCGSIKPISDYHKHAKSKDGFMGICKSCNTERYNLSLVNKGSMRERAPSQEIKTICHTVEKILASNAPRSTRNLVSDLKASGYVIPKRRLGQILCREKQRFRANRKDGWSLT